MPDEAFYALLILIFLVLVIFGVGSRRNHCQAREGFRSDGGIDPLAYDSEIDCSCHNRHTHPREGLCWRKDVHGHYLQMPEMPCKSGKCGCWGKHTSYRNGRCHRPGSINGSMDACRIRPHNV